MEQLYKKVNGEYIKVYPLNHIENILDSESGKTLASILSNFNNIYLPYQDNAKNTRALVPQVLRRKGLWITYNNGEDYVTEYYKGNANDIQEYWAEDYNWEIIPNLKYVQDNASKLPDGIITADKLSPALLQLIQSSGKVVNMADDEDIEEVNSTLKFKDRKYNSELASGKGYKILRKNWTKVGGKMINLLTQDMINEINTIYEIRYDFDLNEKDIIIPEGCILNFNNGSFSNGSINFSNTTIKSDYINIFKDISFKGTFNNININTDWTYNNYTTFLNVCANSNNVQNIYFSNKEYYIEDKIIFNNTYSINLLGKETTIKADNIWRNKYDDSIVELFRFTPDTTNINAQVGDVYIKNITFNVDITNFPNMTDTTDNSDSPIIYCELINSLRLINCKYKTTNGHSACLFIKSYANNNILENCYIENNSTCHVGGCIALNHGWRTLNLEKRIAKNIINNCVFISHSGDESISLYCGTCKEDDYSFNVFNNCTFISYGNEYRGSKILNIFPSIDGNEENNKSFSKMFVNLINCNFKVLEPTDKERIYISYGNSDLNNTPNEKYCSFINCINCNFEGGYTTDNYYSSAAFMVNGKHICKYVFTNCNISTNENNIKLFNNSQGGSEFTFNSCIINCKEIYQNHSYETFLRAKLLLIILL